MFDKDSERDMRETRRALDNNSEFPFPNAITTMRTEPSHTGFQKGDLVLKAKGDYTFLGRVACVFNKLRDGTQVRYVVENAEGILHIFSAAQLTLIEKAKT